ncbi:MAG: hypothetical protein RLO51_03815 [Thalassobaculum sp.]|uniref:hypothetical protein n=1 Tax=Thalassobaculum sp. TaxID=2022740 RepID=UPI0032F099C1
MFGKIKTKAKPAGDAAARKDVKFGAAIFGEESLDIRELHLKGIRIPNPGGGNIINGQKFFFTMKLGEGDSAVSFKVSAFAIAASETEVIGKFSDMDDDQRRLIALHLKAMRAAGLIA